MRQLSVHASVLASHLRRAVSHRPKLALRTDGDAPAGRCPRQESNLHPALRRRVLYPLSYEGGARSQRIQRATLCEQASMRR